MRVLQPGGVFGATTFTKDNGNSFWIKDTTAAFAAMPFDAALPEALPMQTHDSGHWTDPVWIESHLKELGLKNVSVEVKPGSYHIENADEFIRCISMMFGFLMKSFWSEETREAHSVEEVKGLVRRFLEEKYEGKGWDIYWKVIYMTGTVEK